MAYGIRTSDPEDSKFRECSRVRQTPEEGRGHIGRNVMEIAIKKKTIVRKPLMIEITKFRLRNFDN